VPVLDHVGAGGDVGVDIEAKLAVVGRKLLFGIPADGFGVGFGDQVIGLLERARVVADAGRVFSVEIVLRAVIRIAGDDVERAHHVAGIDFRTRWAGEIVRDELLGTLVLVDNRALPGEEVSGKPLRVALPFQLPARIDDAVAGR